LRSTLYYYENVAERGDEVRHRTLERIATRINDILTMVTTKVEGIYVSPLCPVEILKAFYQTLIADSKSFKWRSRLYLIVPSSNNSDTTFALCLCIQAFQEGNKYTLMFKTSKEPGGKQWTLKLRRSPKKQSSQIRLVCTLARDHTSCFTVATCRMNSTVNRWYGRHYFR
jgi:hypothetical protein